MIDATWPQWQSIELNLLHKNYFIFVCDFRKMIITVVCTLPYTIHSLYCSDQNHCAWVNFCSYLLYS